MMNACEVLASRLSHGEFTRVVAFGSSNTERRVAGMHWFDCFELAARHSYGPLLACINSGIGGDTTGDLLRRIERDCLAYHPNLVFITVGGNDANADKGISLAAYRENLLTIMKKLQAIDCAVVLQTYYAMDMAQLGADYTTRFFAIMDTVREVSAASGCMLIDHHARWEPLRRCAYARYAAMMCDAMHVNEAGNLVMGVDIARAFSLALPDDRYFREAYLGQAFLDHLAATERMPACQ